MTAAADDFERLWDRANSGDSQSQFELGEHYWQKADYGRCRRWYRKASKAGNAAALVQLGRQSLLGLGMTTSISDAVDYFSRAAQAGDQDGCFELACLYYRGHGIDRDLAQTTSLLIEAARQGHPGALGCYAFVAAERGDKALFEQASALAIAAGNQRLDAALERRIAAAPAADLHRLCAALPSIAFPPTPQHDGAAPHPASSVRLFDHLLSADECRYLTETARPYLMPSHTVHPQTGHAVRNELRTSHGWSYHPSQEDIAIMRVKERLAVQARLPFDHAEPFALLRYQSGQEYREHFDFIDPASGEAGKEIGRRGQRVITLFCYLTTVPAGGETAFPRLDLKVTARQGRAVMFSNVLADGSIDRSTLHASLPVVTGEKWLATLWFRDRPYQL